MKAKVYFTDMRAGQNQSLLDKVEKLFIKAGLRETVAPGDLVAVKLHFGERGNTGYVRPQFVRRIVDKVKELGGKPFLTDANTLYKGSRSNAVEHLDTAVENGFAYAVMGAPLIIADGLTGKDYVRVPVNRKHFQEVNIGAAAYHADALIAVSHFKGHELVGFGGALKNLGMGLGSRSGKLMMHSDVRPLISPDMCTGCARCGQWCPADAISVKERVSVIDQDKCIGCGECTVTCPAGAIKIDWQADSERVQEKIVEYAEGVLKDKKDKCGFITFVTQVTPDCDCCGFSDAPLVRDIGILASRDPVALDQACADLVNREKVLPGSRLAGKEEAEDKFLALCPGINWRRQLDYAEEIGLGIRNYDLINC